VVAGIALYTVVVPEEMVIVVMTGPSSRRL
jgi:hypothetical protein